MSKEYVLSLDASTTSVRALLFRKDGSVAAEASREFRQHYPKPGWVEHDAIEIWEKQLECIHQVIDSTSTNPSQVAAIGIANQRETTVIWNAETSMPIHNAIVWQDRRTAELCEDLKAQGFENLVRQKTGLVLDSYFSATKIAWILNHVSGARELAASGKLRFGTIDSWLIWKLTAGAAHVTDVSNASRTLLMDIRTMQWDSELMNLFNVPSQVLPAIRTSSEIYGYTSKDLFEIEIPVAASAGDQQASLFGQACFERGMVKCTYGTGASLMMNTGPTPVMSKNGLLTTVACQVGDDKQYAIEGLIFVSAQVVKWLRDELGLIAHASETEDAARRVSDTGGVYFVPAFAGLAVPHWDSFARGTIVGMTLGTNRYHILRAALESIAYQIMDCTSSMEQDANFPIKEIRVDGGASQNDFLMQFQASLSQIEVKRPYVIETTARGAAYLAGLAVGFWRDKSELQQNYSVERVFYPEVDNPAIIAGYAGWKRAVERAKGWVTTDD